MAEENNGHQSISVSVPMGVVATAALVGLASAVAYALMNRDGDESGPATSVKARAKSGKGFGRKVALMSAITLIENDTTRRLVVAVLRAMARRA